MSRYTKKVAARIIAKAVRSGRQSGSTKSPLEGMEANVRKALQYAEYVHRLALKLVCNDEALKSRRQTSRHKREKVSKKFKALMVAWQNLTEEERFDLVWAGESVVPANAIEWWDRELTHIKPIVDRISANLDELNLITLTKLRWPRGRQGSVSQDENMTHLIPLIAFAKALKAFWEPATNSPFGQQFDEHTKLTAESAAANFMMASVPYLPVTYTGTHVKHVMVRIQREGWIAEDDEFRQEVMKVCGLNTGNANPVRIRRQAGTQ